jgi:hypothetical protein
VFLVEQGKIVFGAATLGPMTPSPAAICWSSLVHKLEFSWSFCR